MKDDKQDDGLMYAQDREIVADPSSIPDRRRTKRTVARCDCWLECDEVTIYGFTADIGLSGFFLQTAIPVPPGSKFDIQLRVDESPVPILARGLVVRSILARRGARYGIGVEFLQIKRGQDALLSFLSEKPDVI
jgi:hypothetical protein